MVRALEAELRKAVLPGVWLGFLALPLVAAGLGVPVLSRPGTPAEQGRAWVLHLCLGAATALGAMLAGQELRGAQGDTTRLALPRGAVREGARLAVRVTLGVVAGALAAAALGAGAPAVLLLGAVVLAAGGITDACRSPLGGTVVALAVLWVAPVALAGVPRLLALTPAAAVAALELGAWPADAWPAVAWLGLAVAAGLRPPLPRPHTGR